MKIFRVFENIGRYTLRMQKVFSRPEKMGIYYTRIMREMEALGLNSIGLTAIISVFICRTAVKKWWQNPEFSAP